MALEYKYSSLPYVALLRDHNTYPIICCGNALIIRPAKLVSTYVLLLVVVTLGDV
jgi:hypothetical protein